MFSMKRPLFPGTPGTPIATSGSSLMRKNSECHGIRVYKQGDRGVVLEHTAMERRRRPIMYEEIDFKGDDSVRVCSTPRSGTIVPFYASHHQAYGQARPDNAYAAALPLLQMQGACCQGPR